MTLTDFDTYQLKGELRKGECFLEIADIHARDDGNWQCKIYLEAGGQGAMSHEGPLIHVHVEDLPGNHPTSPPGEYKFYYSSNCSKFIHE